MKDKEINAMVKQLKTKMFLWWEKHRRRAGFDKKCEQDLYDALCHYEEVEECKLKT